MSDFTVLSLRDTKAVKRGLTKIRAGMNLIDAIMAVGVIKAVVRKATPAKRKVRVVRKVRKARKALKIKA